MAFSRVFLLIGGAQQDVGERGVGLQDLARRVCRLTGGEDRDCYCQFLEWHQWREHVGMVHGWAKSDATIDIAGYSYGGDAAVRACWALARTGYRVRNLLLSDAVRRIGLVLPASLWRWWTLKIPGPQAVERCEWWRQRNDWRIWGHRVARTGVLQWDVVGHEVRVPRLLHAQMDEHEGFRRRVLEVAGS